MLNDVAGVELVVVALLGKNYRRIERAGSARRAVRHKMNVGKVGGLALQIRIGRRLRARKYGALSQGNNSRSPSFPSQPAAILEIPRPAKRDRQPAEASLQATHAAKPPPPAASKNWRTKHPHPRSSNAIAAQAPAKSRNSIHTGCHPAES